MIQPKISFCTIKDFNAELLVKTLSGETLTDNNTYPYLWAHMGEHRGASELFFIYFNQEWHEAQSIDFDFSAIPDNPMLFTIDSSWSVEDVLGQAKDDNVIITPVEAKEILMWIDNKHDAAIGINWEVISTFIALWLEDNGRGEYEYTLIDFEGDSYVCREISDPDNEDNKLIVAPVGLSEILKEAYGDELIGCDLDEEIFYYASLDEIVLPESELISIIL